MFTFSVDYNKPVDFLVKTERFQKYLGVKAIIAEISRDRDGLGRLEIDHDLFLAVITRIDNITSEYNEPIFRYVAVQLESS